jgi:hypothetical protein
MALDQRAIAAGNAVPLTSSLLWRVPRPPDVPMRLSGLNSRHEPPSVPRAWGFCFGIRGAMFDVGYFRRIRRQNHLGEQF